MESNITLKEGIGRHYVDLNCIVQSMKDQLRELEQHKSILSQDFSLIGSIYGIGINVIKLWIQSFQLRELHLQNSSSTHSTESGLKKECDGSTIRREYQSNVGEDLSKVMDTAEAINFAEELQARLRDLSEAESLEIRSQLSRLILPLMPANT